MNTQYGAPVTIVTPFTHRHFLELETPAIALPFVRWKTGRYRNPSFSVGSGFEGHLCALTAPEVITTMEEFERDAYRMVCTDVGQRKLHSFIEDPTAQIDMKTLIALRIAFEVELAKARAIRGTTKYGYIGDGKPIASSRRERVSAYENFVHNSPGQINWELASQGNLVVVNQSVSPTPLPCPIDSEPISGDIRHSRRFPLLSQIGRVGHPIVAAAIESYQTI
jgi:hypothetical protein